MKYFVLLVMLFATAAFAADKPVSSTVNKTSDFCVEFDKKMGFSRCETIEVICYRFGKLEQCYLKPQPPKAAVDAPSAVSPKPAGEKNDKK